MTFQEALKNVNICACKADSVVDVIIRFNTAEGNGYASLTAKRFFKDQAKTLFTVKRAWEYACKEHPGRENAVTQIEVRPAAGIAEKISRTA